MRDLGGQIEELRLQQENSISTVPALFESIAQWIWIQLHLPATSWKNSMWTQVRYKLRYPHSFIVSMTLFTLCLAIAAASSMRCPAVTEADLNTYVRPTNPNSNMFLADSNTKSLVIGSSQTSVTINGTTSFVGGVTLADSTNLKGGKSDMNPNGWQSHFPWSGDGRNYIRGDTVVTGHVHMEGSINLKGGKSDINPNGMQSHFPWVGDGRNYIRGDTVVTGHAHMEGTLNLRGGKSDINPNGMQSHFPWPGDGRNYIRGDTVVTGHMNMEGSLNLKGGKSALNPNGWSSHFPWVGDGKNYIRGDTVVTGNVQFQGQICIGNTCLTEAQLIRLLALAR